MPGKRLHDFNEIRKEIENETWVYYLPLVISFLLLALANIEPVPSQNENSRIIQRHLKTAYPPQDLLHRSSQPHTRRFARSYKGAGRRSTNQH